MGTSLPLHFPFGPRVVAVISPDFFFLNLPQQDPRDGQSLLIVGPLWPITVPPGAVSHPAVSVTLVALCGSLCGHSQGYCPLLYFLFKKFVAELASRGLLLELSDKVVAK